MYRVYFDSNVYRYLKNNEKYEDLSNNLLNNKNIISFLYSDAHINDIHQDKTNCKNDDLNFMEKFVNNNCISMHPTLQYCTISFIPPQESYNILFQNKFVETPLIKFDESFLFNNIKLFKDLPIFKDFAIIFESLEYLKNETEASIIDNDKKYNFFNGNQATTPEIQEFLNIFGIENKEYSGEEFQILCQKMPEILRNHSNAYKAGRRLSALELGTSNVSIKDKDFDNKLKKTKINKPFFEFMESFTSFLRKVPLFNNQFMQYTMAYLFLNYLGLDNEKNKKAKFNNTINDAYHSFFGMFSDYVVSNDVGFIEKTRFLYTKFGIETEVLYLEEFLSEFSIISNSHKEKPNSIDELLDEIFKCIKDCFHNKTQNLYSINDDVHVILYKKRLLSYFNIIEINFEPGKSTLLLYNFRPNVDNFLMSREYEYVINALNTILGTDDNNLAEFKDNDRQLLGNEQEYIRKWTNKNTEFKLDYFSRKASLVFSIVTDELVRVYEPDSSDEKEN